MGSKAFHSAQLLEIIDSWLVSSVETISHVSVDKSSVWLVKGFKSDSVSFLTMTFYDFLCILTYQAVSSHALGPSLAPLDVPIYLGGKLSQNKKSKAPKLVASFLVVLIGVL